MDAQTNAEQARRSLRAMPQTRDVILNLLLIEAGLTFSPQPGAPFPKLVKTANVPANLGVTPELALAAVIARHLRIEP